LLTIIAKKLQLVNTIKTVNILEGGTVNLFCFGVVPSHKITKCNKELVNLSSG
jgi:hypothetical protein